MAATLLWDDNATSGQKSQENSLEDLFVFGYACKLFRDDERAKYIDEGRHLIPWMGDERLMIDRYDGRGHLYDLTKHDADLAKAAAVEMTEEEAAVEAACEEERYLELVTDVQEKAMYEEEEWKRYYESLHEGYNAVGFSYEYPHSAGAQEQDAKQPEEQEESFVPGPELLVPDGIHIPETEKEHVRIEKTAVFVAQHGTQMEIMIKTKQSRNAQFHFMNFEDRLNPYYQHLVAIIKDGRYKPQQQDAQDEQDSGDQHYLHPSLSTTTSSITPLPPPPPPKTIVLPKVSIHDTPYGQLVTSLKKYSKTKVEEPATAQPALPPFMAQPDYGRASPPLHALPAPQPKVKVKEEPPPPGTEVMGPLPAPAPNDQVQGCENRTDAQTAIVPPPPDVQPIIDRMAMYVAKNGQEFEMVVKAKQDARFAFLQPGHVHFQYYDFKKNMFLKEAELKSRLEAKQAERERLRLEEEAAAAANRSISFSIRGRSRDPDSVSALKRPLFDYDSSDSEHEGEEGGAKDCDKDSKSRSSSPDLPPPSAPPPQAPVTTATASAPEVKATTADDAEKKQAEERVKDKLAVAARDRLAASGREKQLQAERKRKATMFINLLRIVKENPATTATQPTPPDNETASPLATPSSSKAASPQPPAVVYEYNNRSGTPTRLAHSSHRQRKARSKSPSERRKKRRKKSPTPPSAYADPHRSPPRFSPGNRSRSPRRGMLSRRLSPVRPFRSRRSPSPRQRDRDRSPARQKAGSKRSRTRSPSPAKHKKKRKRSRSKTPKKKKKDKGGGASRDRESAKVSRSHDRSADKHRDKDRRRDKDRKKDRKDRHRSKDKDADRRDKGKDRDKVKVKVKEPRVSSSSLSLSSSSSTTTQQAPPPDSPPATKDGGLTPREGSEVKGLSPIAEAVPSSSSDSSSSSDDNDDDGGADMRPPQGGADLASLPPPPSPSPPRPNGETVANGGTAIASAPHSSGKDELLPTPS